MALAQAIDLFPAPFLKTLSQAGLDHFGQVRSGM
jgi:hypothetical protein